MTFSEIGPRCDKTCLQGFQHLRKPRVLSPLFPSQAKGTKSTSFLNSHAKGTKSTSFLKERSGLSNLGLRR